MKGRGSFQSLNPVQVSQNDVNHFNLNLFDIQHASMSEILSY